MPNWQRAIIKRIDNPEMQKYVGRHIWTEIDQVEPCGGGGFGQRCPEPSIRVNHTCAVRSKELAELLEAFATILGIAEDEWQRDRQDVMHLSCLELLDEFEDELPILSYDEWLAGRER